ncbi:GspE/PulE family protein [Undibacterium flavidum]|uniref:Type II/IV secretion system protein n=1 Tax=Undibacterium flavidum TaxID=2762297 RepID=A0ABR6YB81_9BURK|nr:type II/IV secretion system protein [Undibacterium flavidum]MBC3873883.1 type II/IV secretion system protein [Undibacterium flavidum]
MNNVTQAQASGATFPNVSRALALYGVEVKQLATQYPRIVTIIDSTWGSIDCLHYLDSLLFSERPGRQGFPTDVLDEIVFIKNIFEFSHPQFAVNRNDPISKNKIEEIRGHIQEIVSGVDKEVEVAGFSEIQGKLKERVFNEKKHQHEVDSHQTLRNNVSMMENNAYPKGAKRELLGQYFVENGILSDTALAEALNLQSKLRTRHLLGEILIADHSINEAQLNWALSRQRGIPIVDVSNLEISPEAVRLIPLKIAHAKHAMPITIFDNRIVVAVENPFDSEVQRYFSFLSGYRAILVYSSNEQINAALSSYTESKRGVVNHTELNGAKKDNRAASNGATMPSELNGRKQKTEGLNGIERPDLSAYADNQSEDDDLDEQNDDFSTQASESPLLKKIDENDETVIGLINKTINDAVRFGASDIHFEAFPRTRNSQIRFRKDGKLEVSATYPINFHPAVVSRIKIMASLDISEKRKAQDGKITFGYANKKLDLRVSSIPTSNALEVVTVRILGAGKPLPLSKIGMHPDSLEKFKLQINKPHGLILVCGPTGSGKTTTLHSVLRELNSSDKKIWTAEDPVEIVQKNISQVQVLPKIGWTFAKALRSFLRADPDVIMVGEIRDSETAKVAVEASMTGHLVLSTLHTNSASETLMRMMDLEVAAFNLADATQAILSQRLARRVCTECAERFEFTPDDLEQLVNEYTLNTVEKSLSKQERQKMITRWQSEFGDNAHIYGRRGLGCAACHGTGYKGRMGIHELLVMSAETRRLITSGASSSEIFKLAVKEGMKTLRQDAIEKVLQGTTDLAEIRMVCI